MLALASADGLCALEFKGPRERLTRLEARLRAAETHARDARLDAARNLTGVVESAKQFRNRLRDKSTPASPGR